MVVELVLFTRNCITHVSTVYWSDKIDFIKTSFRLVEMVFRQLYFTKTRVSFVVFLPNLLEIVQLYQGFKAKIYVRKLS